MKPICLFILNLVIIFSGSVFGQKSMPDSVKIDWESFTTETPLNINCDSFEKSFLKTGKYILLTSDFYLKKFNQLRNDSLFKTEAVYTTIDVRGKITFYFSKLKIEYCFDQFGHFDCNGILKNNERLWLLITKIIPKKDQ